MRRRRRKKCSPPRRGARRRTTRRTRTTHRSPTALRSDLPFDPVPFDKLVAPVCPDAKLRRLVRNMIYDGILAKLLGVDLSFMDQALARQLGKKAKAVQMNAAALKA